MRRQPRWTHVSRDGRPDWGPDPVTYSADSSPHSTDWRSHSANCRADFPDGIAHRADSSSHCANGVTYSPNSRPHRAPVR